MLRRRSFNRALALVPGAALAGCSMSPEPLPVVSSGRVQRLTGLGFREVEARPVDVWLPPGYDGSTRHPVVYLHDGESMFDGATSISKTGWQLDRAVAAWAAGRAVTPPILVAVWSLKSQRASEFLPQPLLDQLSPAARQRAWEQLPLLYKPFAADLVKRGRSASEAYLRFLVHELKPAIDARFATRPDRANTFLMGSSYGGLITVHGVLSHPAAFGAGAALSTHWIGVLERNDEISDAAVAWLRRALPSAAGGLRLYLDRGTIELDAQYPRAQGLVDALLRERGFGPPSVVSRVIEGAGHNERDWGARAHQALGFLLDGRVAA